jgi:hypothetical protein
MEGRSNPRRGGLAQSVTAVDNTVRKALLRRGSHVNTPPWHGTWPGWWS